MGLFLGTHSNKVDRKGRVSVPSTFRSALSQEAFQGIVLYRSLSHDHVIEGCGMGYFERIAAAASSQMDVFSAQMDDFSSVIAAGSVQLTWDPEGRIVLPAHMLELDGITEQVTFVGMFQRFQLWNPEAYLRQEQEAKARLKGNLPKLVLPPAEGA
jgi:MraZ protein